MKVSLIYPQVLNLTFPPLGVLYIASVLKKDNHEVMVSIVDNKNMKEELNRIEKFRPSVVGISIVSPTQMDLSGTLMKGLKPLLKDAYFVCGGTAATVFYEFILNNFHVDAIVKGEGEEAIRELIGKIADKADISGVRGIVYKVNGRVITNPDRGIVHNLDEIPFPARELIDFEKYLRPPGLLRGMWIKRSTAVMTSRGCPAHCIYCSSNLIFGRTPRRRSVDNVISEIKHLIERYRVEAVWFSDDTFTLQKTWVMDFTRKLREERIDIKWGCQARVDTVDQEMLEEMKRTGCLQVDLGVESGSPDVLKALKKGSNPQMIEAAFRMIRKVGIRALATFMVGNPQEKHADIEMTSQLARRINSDFTIFFFTTAYPGTELFEMAKRNNWLKNTDYSRWFVREAPALEINFSKDELIRIRSRLQNRFLLRNIISSSRNPVFIQKMFLLVFMNIPAFVKALKVGLKTKSFEDLIFDFIEKTSTA